jgi:hypothetical protein
LSICYFVGDDPHWKWTGKMLILPETNLAIFVPSTVIDLLIAAVSLRAVEVDKQQRLSYGFGLELTLGMAQLYVRFGFN